MTVEMHRRGSKRAPRKLFCGQSHWVQFVPSLLGVEVILDSGMLYSLDALFTHLVTSLECAVTK